MRWGEFLQGKIEKWKGRSEKWEVRSEAWRPAEQVGWWGTPKKSLTLKVFDFFLSDPSCLHTTDLTLRAQLTFQILLACVALSFTDWQIGLPIRMLAAIKHVDFDHLDHLLKTNNPASEETGWSLLCISLTGFRCTTPDPAPWCPTSTLNDA